MSPDDSLVVSPLATPTHHQYSPYDSIFFSGLLTVRATHYHHKRVSTTSPTPERIGPAKLPTTITTLPITASIALQRVFMTRWCFFLASAPTTNHPVTPTATNESWGLVGGLSIRHAAHSPPLAPDMALLGKPLPSIYYPDFIAANQEACADNVIPGNDKKVHLEHICADIRKFKQDNELDHVIVFWTANTERYSDIIPGVNDTANNLLAAIESSHSEVSPSTLFAVAAILEGEPFVNSAPQNTFVPGAVALAERHQSFIGGDDLKSGQTKLKSVLAEFLVNAGIKPLSIASYNHPPPMRVLMTQSWNNSSY